MPPLIKENNKHESKDIKGQYVDDKSELSSHDDPVSLTNEPIGSCQSPHPIDRIVWRNVIVMSVLHSLAIYGLYLCATSAQWKTVIAAIIFYMLGGLGITAGAHRLWSHRSYKARFPLRLILMIFNCMAIENDIYEWSRDHRVHHKFSETDADPHNAERGFFFSHIGWLLSKKHPLVFSKGKSIDCSDILADPLVRFQRRHYYKLAVFFCFILPTLLAHYGWNESWLTSFIVCGVLKYVFTLHMTWLVNSAAHMWGNRPYDRHIGPSENLFVSLGAIGEGFHNYHHTFPWDYAVSEFGIKFNLTTLFIDCMAKIGWAYDCKVVSSQMIKQRKARTGDGSDKRHSSRSNRVAAPVSLDESN